MIENQAQFKCLKAFAIGGEPKDRAALCYSAANDRFAIEPLASLAELRPGDVSDGDAYFVCGGSHTIEELKVRLADAVNFAPIIGFATAANVEQVIEAFEAGATSFIEGPFTPEKVLRAVAAAIQKSRFLGTYKARILAAEFRLKCLTVRERQVLEAAACGLSNKLIAMKLSISPRTVEVHRANAFAKLGVGNFAQAFQIVLEANFDDTSAMALPTEHP